jgi:tetratricopeptide (TPR) repeat protein
LMLAALYLIEGKYKESESQINLGIELAEKIPERSWELNLLLYLEYIYLSLGKPDKSLEACNKAWGAASETDNSGGKRRSLMDKGIAYLAMNSPAEAQKTAAELKTLIDQGLNKNAIRYYYHLLGRIELRKKNYSSAIEYFQKAIALLPYQHDFVDEHAVFMDALASAYDRAGDVEQARQQYEKISRLTCGRFLYGDIFAKSFYLLGRIAERQGERAKARENLQKFLDLWKDADPGIVEIEEARKELAKL